MEVERTNANAVERNEENFQSARENRQLMSFPIVSSLLAVVYQVDNWSQYVAIVEANFKKRKRKSPWAYSHKNIPIDRPRVLYSQFQWVRVPLSYIRQSTMMAFKSRATGTFWIPSMTYQILLWTNNKLLGQHSRFVHDLIKFSDFSYHVTRFLFLEHPGNESFNIACIFRDYWILVAAANCSHTLDEIELTGMKQSSRQLKRGQGRCCACYSTHYLNAI